jgi:hypothetical protein
MREASFSTAWKEAKIFLDEPVSGSGSVPAIEIPKRKNNPV